MRECSPGWRLAQEKRWWENFTGASRAVPRQVPDHVRLVRMNDPFKEKRRDEGVLKCPFQGESIPMILRHADVRAAAKDWETLSSDAPFRVPIPSEEDMRPVRQLPIETDPPEHTAYRKIVEPFFKRAKDPHVVSQVEALTERLLAEALGKGAVEIVREFALPLQSHALTYLLNAPEAEAATWISWGVHVFHDGDDSESKGSRLNDYLNHQLDLAQKDPGEDLFGALTKAEVHGRPLTRDEMLGFANLTFAGGRDTIIHSISSIFHYLSEHPKALDFLRENPKRIVNATEEFFRVISPLTHIGRVCPVETEVQGVTVPPKGRVSLCWASANFDEEAFEAPEETRLDRKPNPHLAFGAGKHLCLGAPHARLIVRTLLAKLCQHVREVTLVDAVERTEDEVEYQRTMGYDSLSVALS